MDIIRRLSRCAAIAALCGAALTLLPGLARSQPGAPDSVAARPPETVAPPVDSLVAEALARSPSVGALRARLDAARRMTRVPGLANPVLEVMVQDASFPDWTVGTMEMSMVQLGLTQSFPPPGRIGAQKAIARAEAEQRDAELQSMRREVASRVRAIYGRLYALDRERDALATGSILLESLARSALDRYRADRVAQEAVLKSQLAASRLDERRTDLETERASMVAELNALLDRPGEEPLGRVAGLPEVTIPGGAWDSLAVDRSADVQARRAAVGAASRRVQLARIGYRPDFMVGGDVGLRGKLDPIVGVRVGIGLPLWESRRARYEAEAAEAELRMAREEQREAEASVRAAAARLGAEWRRAEAQIRLYREGLVPQAQSTLDAARASFLTDRVDFSTVIEDFQMWLETRSQMATREAERFGTWAEIQSLISAAPEAP